MDNSQKPQNIHKLRGEELNKLTEKIIGIAIKVHKTLGPGFVEKIYEKALAHELKKAKLNFMNQATIKVQYDALLLGNQRIDFIVENDVIVEIKSATNIIKIFEYQMLSYLKTSNKRVGLILNFGRKTLEIKRMVHNL